MLDRFLEPNKVDKFVRKHAAYINLVCQVTLGFLGLSVFVIHNDFTLGFDIFAVSCLMSYVSIVRNAK